MTYRERVLETRAERMKVLAEEAWRSFLEGLEEDGEDLADYDAEAVAGSIVDHIETQGLPWPKASVEELRELVPELLPYVSRESLAEVAYDLPRDALAAAVKLAAPKLRRGVLDTVMRSAEPPKTYWYTNEDNASMHDADIKEFAKAEARRRLEEARKP